MLKDITLGQFFPGNTVVHRLDPRTKILAVILYIVALFCADSVLTYAIVAAVLTVCILASKVPFRSLTKGLKPILIIVIFTAVMNLFFTKGTAICDLWLLRHITWDALQDTLALSERFGLVLTFPPLDKALYLKAVAHHLGRRPDVVVVHTAPIPEPVLRRYAAEGRHPVAYDPRPFRVDGVRVLEGDFREAGELAQHDPKKLARAVLKLV